MKLIWLSMMLLLIPAVAYSNEPTRVAVVDPYLDVYSGPGRGYPIIRIVKEGAWITIVKRKNSWFLVQTDTGIEGWVKKIQLERTLSPTGELIAITDPSRGDFSHRDWEVAVLTGDFDGSRSIELSGLFFGTKNLGLEASYGIGLGSFSTLQILAVGIQHQPFPEWRVSPYITLGGGRLRVEQKASLVQSERLEDYFAQTAIGFRSYLSQRFVFRIQYKEYLLFNSDDDNEEIKEWKMGFAVFF